MKLVILARKDIHMSIGKLCAQIIHAALGVIIDLAFKDFKKFKSTIKEYIKNGSPVIVLKVGSEKDLVHYYEQAKSANLQTKLIIDAGKTELEPGTKTCIAIGPAKIKEIDNITGKLNVYR